MINEVRSMIHQSADSTATLWWRHHYVLLTDGETITGRSSSFQKVAQLWSDRTGSRARAVQLWSLGSNHHSLLSPLPGLPLGPPPPSQSFSLSTRIFFVGTASLTWETSSVSKLPLGRLPQTWVSPNLAHSALPSSSVPSLVLPCAAIHCTPLWTPHNDPPFSLGSTTYSLSLGRLALNHWLLMWMIKRGRNGMIS